MPEPGGVLSLLTPLARLYGTAMALGDEVTDLPASLEDDGKTAAVVAASRIIQLNRNLGDDDRADVLAMAIAVAWQMVPRKDDGCEPGAIACDGFIVITTERDPDPAPGAGLWGQEIARACGVPSPAAFRYYVPEHDE